MTESTNAAVTGGRLGARQRSTLAPLLCAGLMLLIAASASQGQASGADRAAASSKDETAPEASEDLSSGLLERSLDQASSLWQRSTESADTWLQRSLEAWDGAQRSLRATDSTPSAAIWKELVPKLDETLQIEDGRETLPERAWIGRDQRDADADVNTLLDASVAILSRSPVQDYRARIETLRDEVASARADIDRFRRARVAAPRESLVATTVAEYDQRIAKREADIQASLAQLEQVKAEFVGELRAMGIELSDDQVDLLLATVVGDNLIDLGIVFDNVKAITLQLETLVEDSGEDLESARRYYGMYVILLRALARMHSDVAEAIETVYVPEINAIAERAAQLSEETRALMKAQPTRAALLRNNLEAQALTIEAAEVYREYLLEQRTQVEQARAALDADIETAWNTYQTVRVSGELVDLVQSSQSLLDGLLDREVPPLRQFQNLEMQRELEKLTHELRRSGR